MSIKVQIRLEFKICPTMPYIVAFHLGSRFHAENQASKKVEKKKCIAETAS